MWHAGSGFCAEEAQPVAVQDAGQANQWCRSAWHRGASESKREGGESTDPGCANHVKALASSRTIWPRRRRDRRGAVELGELLMGGSG